MEKTGTVEIKTGFPASFGAITVDVTENVWLFNTAIDSGHQIRIIKFDSAGNRLWENEDTINTDFTINDATADPFGCVCLTCWNTSEHRFVDENGRTTTRKGSVLLVKYDETGKRLWKRECVVHPGHDKFPVVADSKGNVFVAGAVLAKLDSAGTCIWEKRIIGESLHQEIKLRVGPDGSACIVYESARTGDTRLMKCDPNGNKTWTTNITDGKHPVRIRHLETDNAGNIYASGSIQVESDNQPDEIDPSDLMLIKFDPTGQSVWSRQLAIKTSNMSMGIVLSESQDIYLLGGSYDNCGEINTQLVSIQFDGNGNMGRKTLMGLNSMEFRPRVVKTRKGRLVVIRKPVTPLENAKRTLYFISLQLVGKHIGKSLLREGSMFGETLVIDQYAIDG